MSNLTRHECHTAVTSSWEFLRFAEDHFSSQVLSEPAGKGAVPQGFVNRGLMAGVMALVTVTMKRFDLNLLV